MNAVKSIVAGMLCLTAGAEPLYQCEMTIGGYSGSSTLANFPLLVRISPEKVSQFSYGDCAADGSDISFADADGNVLPHEIDTWNTEGESLVWVKLPSLSGKTTKFKFRWGDAVPPANDPTSVWSDYVGVWHFNENGGLSAADSSPNGFHGSVLAAEAVAADYTAVTVEGQTVGAGRQCTAGTLSFTMPDYSSLEVGGKFTASGIFKMAARTGYESFFNKKQSWNTGNGFQCNMQNSDEKFFICGSGSDKTYDNKTLPNVKSNWTYLTLAYSGTSVTVYNKGGTVASLTINDTGDVARNMTVAGFKGIVDEVRIRKGAASAEWVKAEYDQVTTADFVSAGETEVIAADGIAVGTSWNRYGTVSPGYGIVANPVDGEAYTFTCADNAQFLNDAETERAFCTGWELVSTVSGEVLRRSTDPNEEPYSCTHVFASGEGIVLRWRWQRQYKVTVTAGVGGTVSPAEQWVAEGETATVTATADGTHTLFRWKDESGAAVSVSNPCRVTVDRPRALTAMFGQNFYVAPTASGGSDSHDGSEASPFATIEHAIAVASEHAGATVYVTPGTHKPAESLTISSAMTLIGINDADGKRPTIDGANTYRTLKLTHADARAENLRLYRGYAHSGGNANNGGGGLNISAGTVVNCEFADCYSAGEVAGGSITLTGGTLSRCTVHGGYTVNGNGNGAGAYVNGSNALVEHCLFYGNSQNGRQGATSKIGAVYLNAGTVRNCTIVNNNMGKAGGIYVAKGAKFYDSIVWGNVAQNDTTAGAPNWQMASGAYVTNICTTVAMGVTTGGRNLTTYPNFKDLAANDCRLMPGSPCIDAGSFAYPADTLDLAGNPRTTGTATDLGAYELDANEKAVGIEYAITGNLPGDTLTYVAVTTGFGDDEVAAYWNFSDIYPTAEAHDAEGMSGSLELQAGIYSISLTVVSGGQEYHYQVKSGFTVYGLNLKVVDGNPNAKPPYDTWDNAAANVADAVALATEGTVITLSNGTHKLTKPIDFSKKFTVQGLTGDPKDVTVDGQKARLCADIKCAGAVIRDIRLYNGSHNQGGVVSMTANGRVEHCIVDTGYSGGNERGGCIYMTDGTVSRSIVKNGHTTSGSGDGDGIYMTGGTVEHSLIANNKSNWTSGKKGAGIYLKGGLVRNCTIVGNTGSVGGGVYLDGGKMIDSIVWGNKRVDDGDTDKDVFGAKATTVTNTWSSTLIGTVVGVVDPDNFFGDPGFVDAEKGDYRLSPSSKCKDAAWGPATVELDLAGADRVQGKGMDVGCYETDATQKAVGIDYSITGNLPGDILTYAVAATGFGDDELVAYWNFSDVYPTADAYDAKGLGGTLKLEAGVYSISLVVLSCGVEYRYQVKSGFTVYGMDMKVVAGNPNAKPPYDTWANAASNIADAVVLATDETVITLSNGTHVLTAPINFVKAFTVQGLTGDPKDVTVDGQGKRLCASIGCDGATVRDLRLYNGSHDLGGVVSMTARGTIDHCIIDTGYSGGNQSGGCVYMSAGTISRSIVKNGHTTNGMGEGDGVFMDGDGCVLEHSLVVGNQSSWPAGKVGAGVYLKRGLVRNCTIYGNTGSEAGGIWVGSGGKVLDTIVWGNTTFSDTSVGAPNFQMEGGAKVTNCWSSVQFGVTVGDWTLYGDPAFVDAAHGDFTLGASSKCKDAAWGPATVELDLAGSNRVQGAAMDLGCYESNPDAFAVDFDFTQDGTVDEATNVFTLVVTPEGTDLSNTRAYWTFDGRTPSEEDFDATGLVATNVFCAGSYDIAMLVVHDGRAQEPVVKEDVFKVYASRLCLDAANVAGAARPWNTWANAATNVSAIVPYLTDGTVVLVKPGSYPLASTIDLKETVVFRGVGADGVSAPTVAERPAFVKSGSGNIRAFRLMKKGSRLEHLSIENFNLSNSSMTLGATVSISEGTLADCTIAGARAGENVSGGGVGLSGTDAYMTRCIVTNCQTSLTSGSAGPGGGVVAEGGSRVDNCLIVDCKSQGVGGVLVKGDARLANCVVIGCATVVQGGGSLSKANPGGVSTEGGTVANCVIRDNRSGIAGIGGQVAGHEKWYLHNAFDYLYGANSVTNAPLYRDAERGDWHLTPDSPYVNAGVNLDYTAESKDFEGNQRIFKFGLRSGKADIGLYESPWGSPGMLLLVR